MDYKQINELIVYAMQAEYDQNYNIKIIHMLEDIFKAEKVIFHDKNENFHSDSVLIPITVKGKVYACYEIVNHSYMPGLLYIQSIATILNQMYTNILINYRKNEKSEIDISTNTFNRNYFESHKRAYALEKHETLGCVYADLNGLHDINNTYGHAKGDEVIFEVANSLTKAFENDSVFRIGGDEFVVLINDTNSDYIRERVVFVREYLESKDIHLSIGINYGPAPKDIDSFIKVADQMMYQEKEVFYNQQGNNRRRR